MTANHKQRWFPHVTVAAVIEKDNNFLLVEEAADSQIVYNQPAGHLEKNETLFAAVTREVMEETGWSFVPTTLIGIYQYRSQLNNVTYQRYCFTGIALPPPEPPVLDPAIINTIWLTPAEIKANYAKLRSPLVLQAIEDYLANQRFPLSIIKHINYEQ